MISLDTETTGMDFHHGAQPYFVTTCTGDGVVKFWEWDVDPLTRQVTIPLDDLREISEYLFADGDKGPIGQYWDDRGDGGLILQNAKFDFHALRHVGFWDDLDVDQVWQAVNDTLMAGHLLHSSMPHNLTDMAVHYLGVDIQPYEDALEAAVKDCRRKVQQAKLRARRGLKVGKAGTRCEEPVVADTGDPLANWAIAQDGRADMPSAGSTVWKYDTWLPRAMCLHFPQEHPPDHPYWTVAQEYANADSQVTVALWKAMRGFLNARKLMRIYRERMKSLSVAYKMEIRGVTISGERLHELTADYRDESDRLEKVCVNIAKGYGHTLELPKGGVNNNLREFMFGKLKLKPEYNPKAKSDAPTLNKATMAYYAAELAQGTKPHLFITSLLEKRARDVAITYMDGYQNFWIPLHIYNKQGARLWYCLYPSLNATGSQTLRWSSSQPNEQNISKREGFNLRYTFGPAPGREWWSLDARGIEDRLPAYKSKQQELIDIFERDKEPPYYGSNHLLRFHTVYPDVWDAAVKEVGLDKAGPYCKKKYAATYYQWCKSGGFAVQYGAIERPGGGGTADKAFHKNGAHKLLKERFSKLEALNQHCIQYANKYGYIETMPDRTVDPERGYPIMCARTEQGFILPTVPLNYYIQGTAMWWTMKAMIRTQALLDGWNAEVAPAKLQTHGYFLVMQVHDELVLDFPKAADPKTDPDRSNLARVKQVQKLMEQGGDDIGIPTPTGLEYHPNNWSEGISV